MKFDHAPELIEKKYKHLPSATEDMAPDEELQKLVHTFKAEYTLIPAPGVVGKFQQQMHIERESLVRSSGHFEVYESTVANIFQDQKFEDKVAMVQNDDHGAVESLKELFGAF